MKSSEHASVALFIRKYNFIISMSQFKLIIQHYEDFDAIRKLLINKKYRYHRGNGIGSFNNEYDRKRNRKLQQRELFKTDDRFKAFFLWIELIREKLGVNNIEFAALCNVTPQTTSSWRNYDGPNGGQFPSKDAFKILKRLEIVCEAKVITKKKKVPIRDKGLPPVKVKMPKGRLRLKANYIY